MARKEFILQGFSPRSHVNAIQELFDVSEINRVLLTIAYIKESGVEQIENKLRENAARVTVFAGIRNDITSYQALRRLYEIPGLTLYAFDTGTPNITFHPKVYFVRGNAHARLVLGSANLTLGGLQNNIEAGMLFDFDLSDADDLAVSDQVVAQIEAMPAAYPDNILRMNSLDIIEQMFDNGLITDELDIPPPRPARSRASGTATTGDRVPRIRLALPSLRSSRTGPRTRPARHVVRATPTPTTSITAVLPGANHLVWQSKPLTERDLNIPTGANTHATGSMSLDKGLLPDAVDHRHYFRNVVFLGQAWTTNPSGTVEYAYAKFALVLRGVSHGEFDLNISHTTSTTSASYLQRNAMTRLSWGPMAQHVRQRVMIGQTLSLYRDMTDPTRFVLEIN